MPLVRALALAAMVIGCSGPSKPAIQQPAPPRQQTVRVDCETFQRHMIAIGGYDRREMAEADWKRLEADPAGFYAARCSDRDLRTTVDLIPQKQLDCIMNAHDHSDVERCASQQFQEDMAAYSKAKAAEEAREFECYSTFTRGSAGRLAGTVHNFAKEVLVGVSIAVKSKDRDAQVTMTDEDGRYIFKGLPPGHYTVIAYYGERSLRQTCVVVSHGETTTVDIAIPAV